MAENTTILLETAGFAILKMNTDFYNTEIRWILSILYRVLFDGFLINRCPQQSSVEERRLPEGA